MDVIAKLPADFFTQLESKKWSERKNALQILADLMKNNIQLDQKLSYGEIVSTLNKILAKDSNVIVASVAAKCMTSLAIGLRKNFAQFCSLVTPTVLDKLKEKKPILRDPLIECIDAIFATTNLECLEEELVSALESKNPNIKIQTALLLQRTLRTLNQKSLPKKLLKRFVPILIKHTSDSDVEVRNAACCALGSAMKAIGEKPIMIFLQEIADDKIKMNKIREAHENAIQEAESLEAEALEAREKLEKPSSTDEFGSVVTNGHPPCSVSSSEVIPQFDPWDLLDPVNVIAKLPTDFYIQVESKKWSERRDALQILADLISSNPRLDPKHNHGEIVAILNKILAKDSNVIVASVAAKCMTSLAIGLRKNFAQFCSLVTPTVLDKLKEKKPILRDPLIECIDAILATTNLECLEEELVSALESKNPNIKIQTDLFLHRTLRNLNQKSLPKKLLKRFAPLLIKHTFDPDPEVRDAAYSALGFAMKAVGEKPMLLFLADIVDDKLKMGKIMEFFHKAKEQADNNIVASMVQSVHKINNAPKTDAVQNCEEKDKEQLGTAESTVLFISPSELKPLKLSGPSSNSARPTVLNKKLVNSRPTSASRKLLKWNFTTPDEENVEQLKCQLTSVVTSSLHAQLFHHDFKQHLKAIEVLNLSMEKKPTAAIAASDLLLKWVTLRLFDTNPSVLLKCLDLTLKLLLLFVAEAQQLTDFDVVSFVPYLLLKAGDPKILVRQGVRQIMDRIYELYPASKVYPLLLEATKTKNYRQKADCLEQMGELILIYGIVVCGLSPTPLKSIGVCIGERDVNVRNAALNAIVSAWKHVGTKVFKMTGKLNAKDTAMLEERIERSGKTQVAPPKQSTLVKKFDKRQEAVTKGQEADTKVQEAEVKETGKRPDTAPALRTGRFKLDLDQVCPLEEPGSTSARADPPLIDTSYLMPLLDSASMDVSRPSRCQNRPLSCTQRTTSAASVSSLDASQALDSTISQIGSSSLRTAVNAAVQIHDLVGDKTKLTMMSGKVDQLLTALYFQLRQMHHTQLNDKNVVDEGHDLVQLYRNICALLISLVGVKELINEATEGPIKDLIYQFLTVLIDDRLKELNDGHKVIKSINVLTIKLVENCDPTAIYLALSRLLRESLSSPTSSTMFQNLVLKCLWKFTRLLPQLIERTDFSRILLETHQFMAEHPIDSQAVTPTDMPLRTVKTVLSLFAKTIGDKLLDHVDLIDQPHRSEAVIYVRKCLRDRQRQQPLLTAQIEDSSVNRVYAEVVEIVKVVSKRETTKQGLADLNTLLQSNPDAKKLLDAHLQETSTYMFRNYVERGLADLAPIQAEPTVDKQTNGETSTVVDNVPNSALQRLQQIRAILGLADPQIPRLSEPSEISLPAVKTTPSKPVSQRSRMTAAELDELKRRLDQVKRGSDMP